MLKRYIGTAEFYRMVLRLMLPIMVQNGVTNLVNMVDNIMVGRVGTVQMTGVAVANQLIFVLNLCIFGAISGAGIFGAQFFGKKDYQGVRYTFRFKVIFCLIITAAAALLFIFGGQRLIGLYLKGEGSAADAAGSLSYAYKYLMIMLVGLLPYTLAQCYSSTLREAGSSVPPMAAGLSAVAVNLCLNYILIFGHFGAPRLGVAGAAIATVASRFVELAIVALWCHLRRSSCAYFIGVYRGFGIPLRLVRDIAAKGAPLMLNETLWAAGVAAQNQCYSLRGLDVVAANNISQTFWNVFSVAFMAVGVSIGIILGTQLGAGEKEEARDTAAKLIAFSLFVSVTMSAIYFFAAGYIPHIYETSEEIRLLAARLMKISALCMPIDAFANASYFTLRSGGKVFVTFLFDSGFVLAVSVPVALALTHFTSLSILAVFTVCQLTGLIKCVVGYLLVKRGIWVRSLVSEPSSVEG